ncbi:MAG: hypothetical protein ISR65_04965 [Bacteriovoracaceae bacterium]|nr:hypothetical protein [Bacteriovoracaceae bacterium]
MKLIKLLSILFLLITLNVYGSDDEFDSEFAEDNTASGPSKGLEFTGFLEFEQGANLTGVGPHRKSTGSDSRDWVMAGRRFRLKTSKTNDSGGIFGKFDFVNDDIINKTYIDIRELKLQYTPVSWMDISIGRQVSTWGVADMLFINDLFPKNWVANFQGRDMESMKDPSNSLRVTTYFGDFSWDIVYHPKFTPDTTPTGCYFSIYDMSTGGLTSNTNSCTSETISADSSISKFKNGEVATSLKTKIFGQEVALYGYHGFYKSPRGVMMVAGNPMPHYPKLNVFGASSEGQIGPGIVSFEIGYYDSPEDKDGTNFLIENSSLKFLLGHKIDLSSNLSIGVQWFQEIMMDYDQYKASAQAPTLKKKSHNTFTLRVTYKTMQETLWFNLFTYIRPDDKDSFTKFDVTKRLDDNFSIAAGVNIFTGKKNYLDRDFGMLKDDDNAFVRFRYNF